MLVLSRKTNEIICIGDNIEVQILQVSGNVVRLGIKAPREIPVIRNELRKRAGRKQHGGSRGSVPTVVPESGVVGSKGNPQPDFHDGPIPSDNMADGGRSLI